jgi:hypothetical protein
MSQISTTAPTKSPTTSIEDTSDYSISSNIYIFFYSLIVLIWVISGLFGFIVSIICLFYESSPGEKILGLVLGIFTGPFYWLYYILNVNYCNNKVIPNY